MVPCDELDVPRVPWSLNMVRSAYEALDGSVAVDGSAVEAVVERLAGRLGHQ